MAEIGVFAQFYENLYNSIPKDLRLVFILLFFTLVMVVYAIVIYYFYTSIAKKNVLKLDLAKYNTSDHEVAMKFFGVLFYILEYIIIIPVLTLIWFAILSIFLLIMVKNIDVLTILSIAAAFIVAVRVTAYLSEELAKEMAKMVPFTLLGLAMIDPNFLDIPTFFQRLGEIPDLLINIPYCLLFIILLEVVMRMIDLISSFAKGDGL